MVGVEEVANISPVYLVGTINLSVLFEYIGIEADLFVE